MPASVIRPSLEASVASDVIESSSLESSISAVVSRVARLLVSSRVYNISISAMRLLRLHMELTILFATPLRP